jgi:hypothetical protein
MSKTQTSHEPGPDELEAAAAAPADDHVADAHAGDVHGGDAHGHGEEALGPVDVQAWGALVLGVAAGLLVAFCLVIATTLLAPAAI